MATNWRISMFNGVLLACYFVPSWMLSAMKIWVSPIRGFYAPDNIAVAMYVSDYVNLPAMDTVRVAWLLALARAIVAAFFLVFLILAMRNAMRGKGGHEEALGFALGIGSFISMASLIAASKVGERAALGLHASETLLLIGAAILLIVDTEPDATAVEYKQAVAPISHYMPASPSS